MKKMKNNKTRLFKMKESDKNAWLKNQRNQITQYINFNSKMLNKFKKK